MQIADFKEDGERVGKIGETSAGNIVRFFVEQRSPQNAEPRTGAVIGKKADGNVRVAFLGMILVFTPNTEVLISGI